MEIDFETQDIPIVGKMITGTANGEFVSSAFLYPLINRQGNAGFLEDVFVDKNFRGEGIGEETVRRVIIEAQTNCYKLVGNTRDIGLVEWYTRFGFRAHGYSFRLDFPKGS